jgi:hypothetical protein
MMNENIERVPLLSSPYSLYLLAFFFLSLLISASSPSISASSSS